jgi:hypothetical protein
MHGSEKNQKTENLHLQKLKKALTESSGLFLSE